LRYGWPRINPDGVSYAFPRRSVGTRCAVAWERGVAACMMKRGVTACTMNIEFALSNRERVLDKKAVEILQKTSGLNLLLTGALRLGDLLFAFPAINYLLACESIRELTVLCFDYAAPILAGLDNQVKKMELSAGSWNLLKKWRMVHGINQKNFDAAIVLDEKRSMRKLLASTKIPTILIEPTTGLRKTAQHLQSMVRSFPAAGSSKQPIGLFPAIRLPRSALERAQNQAASIARPRIAFHVGCQRISRKGVSFEEVNRTATKLWHVERFLELGQMLIARLGATVVMVGSGPSERAVAEEFVARLGPKCMNAVGWGDSLQIAALLQQADALVASDGGVLHLGTAVGLKVVAVWGPTPIEIFGPSGPPERLKILRKEVHCSPCKKGECADRICLSSISAGEAFAALEELLGVDVI